MNRNVQNLERLCQKMQARYGQEDSLVMQLQFELTQLRDALERKRHWPPASYLRDFDRRKVQRTAN
jgi:hypothetical protein